MRYDVVTIGDAFEDVFVEPELKVKSSQSFASGKGICFEFGDKVPLNFVQYEIGGSACNLAVGFSRQGFNSGIVTLLGDDTPRDKVLERLDIENVGCESVNISRKYQTGFSVIFSIGGERTIFVYHSVKNYGDLKIKDDIRSKWFFVAPLGDNTKAIEERMIKEVSENGSKIAWNPGSAQIAKGASHFKHLLNCTSVLFLNREEAIKFLNFSVRPQADEMMKHLHAFGPKIVVVTNGKEGAKAYDGQSLYNIEADKQTDRVDATGAGDSFASGFLGCLLEEDFRHEISKDKIREALKWGIANSNSVIKYIGAQRGLLNRKEIEK